MNLQNWLKGLGVAVLSAFVTAIGTMTVAPESFNFSKAGLIKLAMVAAPIAVKAVIMYFKQSPLTPPASDSRPGNPARP